MRGRAIVDVIMHLRSVERTTRVQSRNLNNMDDYKRSLRYGRDDKVCGVIVMIAATHTAYSET